MSDDILVRIPLSGVSQFHPLALAPGLPMLDARKLTYQVLLGWFGDVLAEPELTDEGVLFHVQESGRRQPIVEKALATTADLSGPLAGEFEKLKQALFDVRPDSPSERRIFNRLQPPIGNPDGYLYRVKTGEGSQRLVWCWGFQKRSSDAQAMICSSQDCALLFLQQDATVKICPRCEEPLIPKKSMPDRRSRFPLGAVAATAILGGLAAGTYWFPVLTGAEETGDLPGFPTSDLGEASDIPGEGFSSGTGEAVSGESSSEGNAKGGSAEEGLSDSGTPRFDAVEALLKGDSTNPGETTPGTKETSEGNDPKEKLEDGTGPLVTLPEPEPAGTPDSTEPTVPVVEEKPGGQLSWHRDYLAAYDQAADSKTRLMMLFLGEGDIADDAARAGLESFEAEVALSDVTRLHLPVDFQVDGTNTPLLQHRSFRHLGGQPGIVLIELSDPNSPLFGQAVSALPLTSDGRFPVEQVKRLIGLPGGSIGQRSLLFALRGAMASESGAIDSPLFNLSPNETLNDLANRNSRYMAHFGRVELFESGRRLATLRETFGKEAVSRELTFGTLDATSIQEAATQAVRHWTSTSTSLNDPATTYGLDLFQSPETGRWYATLILVK